MKRVIIESPYAGDVEANVTYARQCLRDCLVVHDEAPYASHLLYTQPGVLDDASPEERKLGMRAGFSWIGVADATVVYVDRGISRGMAQGILKACAEGREIEFRAIDGNPTHEEVAARVTVALNRIEPASLCTKVHHAIGAALAVRT